MPTARQLCYSSEQGVIVCSPSLIGIISLLTVESRSLSLADSRLTSENETSQQSVVAAIRQGDDTRVSNIAEAWMMWVMVA